MTVDAQKVKKHVFRDVEYNLTEKDVALYAISIGADKSNLKFVYEQNEQFCAIPSMGVVFPYDILLQTLDGFEGLEFDPMMLLHGEQYMEILSPIPTRAKLVTRAKVNNLLDKGSGALLVVDAITSDKETGKDIVFNQFSLFIRGMGGFDQNRSSTAKTATTTTVDLSTPPKKECDAKFNYKTSTDQAILYRLAGGDLNPLHVDPEMSKLGGFDVPILHGLCTFGIACRSILAQYCDNDPSRFKSMRVRFSKHVFPGETIQTQMWTIPQAPNKVIFNSLVLERPGAYPLTGGIAEIIPSSKSKL
ncbi:hypothetical peroxisomal multifunctional enzyme 2 [Cavenderia fasciculata]|uniref:Hypothetical peroxisomal multifunctional enzyme 2 n=1 Tax=Cavenderia fasciculata TaxID=261658 RepID=F4PSB4_CACFS|nr:putative peroxisomal multifunctional enzyme 2 [Cavenderia fasciculata]EGG20660.1 hypothetical peroxisomal multifunctional enzyme 2 [Cavenderia fasciculata]|eukprot:XP_004358510.1 hypothetical peroxisomal multifunctional enzyme 2 [Cavenderia fasciculata]